MKTIKKGGVVHLKAPAPGHSYPHYQEGASATVLESYSTLSPKTQRWWHYKLKFHKREYIGVDEDRRGLSRIGFFTRDQVI